MATASRTTSFPLLSLPYEIRRLIYAHVHEKDYIILPFPQPCRYGRRNMPRPRQNIFFHPDAGNLHVYGINSSALQWIVRQIPMPDIVAMRLDYDSPCGGGGSRYLPNNSNINNNDDDDDDDDGYGRGSRHAFPLALTCRQLHHELRDFITATRATFAFADFRSLIIWLKRTDRELLASVRIIKLEMHLEVEDGGSSSSGDGGVKEADEPWFDALKMVAQRLTGLRAFSVHAELCGPALEPTQTFGPFRRIPRASESLKAAFDGAARRVIDAVKQLGGGTDDGKRKVAMEARHVVIKAVQRYAVDTPGATGAEWTCRGRPCDLEPDIDEQLAALEIMPHWQVSLLARSLLKLRGIKPPL